MEVLVDCPGSQGLYTYRMSTQELVQPGDIVSVPFGSQQVGAVAIALTHQLPPMVEEAAVREINNVVSRGFFPASYWAMLQKVAEYYCTPLIQVVRAALPPGLLGRSQRRIRLQPAAVPSGAEVFLQPAAQQLLTRLQASKKQDYTWTYLKRNIRGAHRGLQDLLQRGWVESYLEPPNAVKPKQQKAVTLTGVIPDTISRRQQDVLDVLKRRGGDIWLTELLQQCKVSSSVVHTLSKKGAVVIQSREVLRLNSSSVLTDAPKTLTSDQQRAVDAIASCQTQGYRDILLHGVTGSGKTEVYLQAIAPIIAAGKSALVLVPEIGLTPQLTDRFVARFGNRVQVYHSGLSDGERYDTWRHMLRGIPSIVIGTRSAIFVPLPQLGLIVLDEEHDGSFKQDRPAPCYHARNVAQWRAKLEHCPLLMGTATPSLETWSHVHGLSSASPDAPTRDDMMGYANSNPSYVAPTPQLPNSPTPQLPNSPTPQSKIQNPKSKIQNPKFPPPLYLSLPNRVHTRPLPPIDIVDMRREFLEGHRSIFSRRLLNAIGQLREKGQQGILFIHRRGHSTFVSCRSCGHVLECADCDVSLSYHHTQAEALPYLRCHYCGMARSHPEICPACHSPYLKHFGSGTQRVTQELTKIFPDIRYLRYDSDTTRTKGSHRALMQQFAQGEADILVGTQMLTKGIDIPHVTLVGVMAADGLLHMADYRAGERTYQTLTQVAGRAGRGEQPGQVIIQTYAPSHPILEAIRDQRSYAAVMEYELEQRAALNYPPYHQLIVIKLSGTEPIAVQQAADQIARRIQPEQFDQQPGTVPYELLGPAPAAILRVARRFRWQILLKCPVGMTQVLVQQLDLRNLRHHCSNSVSLTVDIDPLNLL
ncbi:MAG: primosomal protein N' [Cyanobacteria bacterium P01_F01_bin.150]